MVCRSIPRPLISLVLALSCAAGSAGVSAAPMAVAVSARGGVAVGVGKSAVGGYEAQRYVPAVLRLSFTAQKAVEGNGGSSAAPNGFIDITLIPPQGEVVGRRVEVVTKTFSGLLRGLYTELSKQEVLAIDNPQSPSRQLYRLLIEPVRAELTAAGVTTLLISADPGLQAIPYAALHDGRNYLGESYGFSLTPSLGLMPLDAPESRGQGQQLAAGASRFEGLNPLPLVPQELSKVVAAGKEQLASTYLNEAFTPQALINKAGDNGVQRVHVATHAEFLPGGPSKARLYTGTQPLSLKEFASLRQRREGSPMQLFVLSACRTALGDRDSELGFAGLALQAGSRSAIGSLWYVDDVATSGYFVQFYRYLDAGIPKAEAMQLVRRDMASGRMRLEGDRLLVGQDPPLLENLSKEQQRRVSEGLRHPYFWAGIELLGTPW